jgi:putative flippase GtrA
MIFNLVRKRDIFLSFVCGFFAGVFLTVVIKNPHVDEFKKLADLGGLLWLLPFFLAVAFSSGVLIVKVIFKRIKIFFQFVKFAETGVLNTFIDMGVYNGLVWFSGVTSGLGIIPINVLSFSCATINSYFWNKHWTFDNKEKAKAREFVQFLAVSLVGMGINTFIVFFGTTFFFPFGGLSSGAWLNLVKVGAILVSMIWNFLGYKFIVFRK